MYFTKLQLCRDALQKEQKLPCLGKSKLIIQWLEYTGFSFPRCSLGPCFLHHREAGRGWPGAGAPLTGSRVQLFSHPPHFRLNRELPVSQEVSPPEVTKVRRKTNSRLRYPSGPTGYREISGSATSFTEGIARGRCRGRGRHVVGGARRGGNFACFRFVPGVFRVLVAGPRVSRGRNVRCTRGSSVTVARAGGHRGGGAVCSIPVRARKAAWGARGASAAPCGREGARAALGGWSEGPERTPGCLQTWLKARCGFPSPSATFQRAPASLPSLGGDCEVPRCHFRARCEWWMAVLPCPRRSWRTVWSWSWARSGASPLAFLALSTREKERCFLESPTLPVALLSGR